MALAPVTREQKRSIPPWGMVPDDYNSFGTHEFLELCSLLKCEPYIAANLCGSGESPAEMQNWLRIHPPIMPGNLTLTNMRKQNGREQPWKVAFWG